MTFRFRFGIQVSQIPSGDWRAWARTVEELGYSTIFVPDHFGAQPEPGALLASLAGVTRTLCLGSLVFNVDHCSALDYARIASTLQMLCAGRHEFGIGAGWKEDDYVQAGLACDPPGQRIERLAATLALVSSHWQKTASGRALHATSGDSLRAPRVLVGGGGRRLLALAARCADIIGINPMLAQGRILADTARDLAPEGLSRKLSWIRRAALAAGRDPETLELSVQPYVVQIEADAGPRRASLAARTGMSASDVQDCPLFLTGSGDEICDALMQRRERTGISYIVIPGNDLARLEQFAEAVVAPLRAQ